MLLIRRFVSNCHGCRRVKPRIGKPVGLLKLLPIPKRLNLDYTIDFITNLPESPTSKANAILVVVDRINKIKAFLPYRFREGETDAVAVADLLYKNV